LDFVRCRLAVAGLSGLALVVVLFLVRWLLLARNEAAAAQDETLGPLPESKH
jgi:hypothetical protein